MSATAVVASGGADAGGADAQRAAWDTFNTPPRNRAGAAPAADAAPSVDRDIFAGTSPPPPAAVPVPPPPAPPTFERLAIRSLLRRQRAIPGEHAVAPPTPSPAAADSVATPPPPSSSSPPPPSSPPVAATPSGAGALAVAWRSSDPAVATEPLTFCAVYAKEGKACLPAYRAAVAARDPLGRYAGDRERAQTELEIVALSMELPSSAGVAAGDVAGMWAVCEPHLEKCHAAGLLLAAKGSTAAAAVGYMDLGVTVPWTP